MIDIFVDFEMNPVNKRKFPKEFKNLRREIIEIGAVAIRDDTFEEIASFRRLVKPDYNDRIPKHYEELTGISTAQVLGEDHFGKAFPDFVAWCMSFQDELSLYAWSGSDLDQVTREIAAKQLLITEDMQYLFCYWFDFQMRFERMLGLKQSLALHKALDYSGIGFEGRMHDALYDARNTAELYKASIDEEAFLPMSQRIRTAVTSEKETLTASLGNLFDFGSIMQEIK